MQMFYGAIVGDIVGSVYEFNNIKSKTFPLFSKHSFVTDDSVMTLAVARALLDAVDGDVFDALTDDEWHSLFIDSMIEVGRPHPEGYGGKFRRWLYGNEFEPYNSCGNGSAMRCSPVAYFARSLEECERLARLSAEVSHNHPDGVAGAKATAGATYLALHDASKEDIKAYVEKFYPINFTLDEIRPDYYFGHEQALCRGTVPYAVEAFLESKNFEDCIRNTISIGGDSDTLAAISGAIAEAYYGTPHEYYKEVWKRLAPDLREIMERLDGIDWPKA